jgi:hypothetical protein
MVHCCQRWVRPVSRLGKPERIKQSLNNAFIVVIQLQGGVRASLNLNPAVGRVVGASACGAIVVGSARKRSLLQLRHRTRWVNGEIGHSPVSIQLPGDESAVN